mgnify:FL=1
MSFLSVENIDTFYDISQILFDVSLNVEEKETVCLLGRNGVGKTTTMRSIMGLTPPRNGEIVFCDKSLHRKKPFEIARSGIAFVPEDRGIFPDLTVKENLEMGLVTGRKKNGQWNLKKIYELFPVLGDRSNQDGGTLSGGEQQMLTVARALMSNPRLLMLDEPCEGLAPVIVNTLEEQIQLLKSEGMTILLTEQNASFALRLSERAFILEKGMVCWSGSTVELKENPEIMKKYLGV